MNFDLDDPLGDLLSDGSNDSFFDNLPKKTGAPKASPLKGESKKMASLFGIEESKLKTESPARKPLEIAKNVPPVKPPTPPIITTKKPTELTFTSVPTPDIATRPTKPVKANSFNDDDSASDLGFDPKKPKAKSNIMDDMFGPSKVVTPLPKPRNSANLSRQTTIEHIASPIVAEVNSAARSVRRPNSGAAIKDPLGLFSNSKEPPKSKAEEKKKVVKKTSSLDWLSASPEEDSSRKEPEADTKLPSQSMAAEQVAAKQSDPAPTSNVILSINQEAQQNLQILKQQQSQLSTSSQMQQQEEKLMEIQKRQQDLLTSQEQQFQELVTKQIQRQLALEAQINQQQQLINSHIQILLSQPSNSKGSPIVHDIPLEQQKREPLAQTDLHTDSDLRHLEHEKLALEQIIANVNVNHEKEIELIEQSHARQLEVLVNCRSSIEDQLKLENKLQREFFEQRITLLEDEKGRINAEYEQRFAGLQGEHAQVVSNLRTEQNSVLDYLKEDNRRALESVRQSKLLEFACVQENTSYLQTLKSASSELGDATQNIQQLRDTLYERLETVNREKEAELTIRERKITDLERQVALSRDATEEERNRLLALVITLEDKLSQVGKAAANEEWVYRQKLATLTVERTAFERERDYAREQQARDEKRLEEIKQTIHDDQERSIRAIDEQRRQIIVEQAKLDTNARLHKEKESRPIELDAAIRIAEDAVQQADAERERFLDGQRQCELKKRQLIDQENALRAKSEELTAALANANSRERMADTKSRQFRIAEQNIQEKMELLQNFSRDLSERETKIAEQKLQVGRERLQIDSLRKKLFQSRCSLCKIDERQHELTEYLSQSKEVNGDGGEPTAPIDLFLDREVEQSLLRMKNFDIELSRLPNIVDLQQFDTDNNRL